MTTSYSHAKFIANYGLMLGAEIVNKAEEEEKQSLAVHRDDFWASQDQVRAAPALQLNFFQHVFTILKQHGRAVIVIPDNIVFEGGAGETQLFRPRGCRYCVIQRDRE